MLPLYFQAEMPMKFPKRLKHRWTQILLALLSFCFWPQTAHAEHLCAGRSNEYTVSEVYDQTGKIVEYWCEWGSDGHQGAAEMRYFSPEEWAAFAKHGAEVEAANSEQRKLIGLRYRQLQEGLWFLPGEEPFAGWSPEPASGSQRATEKGKADKDCTVSYWTPAGAVIMSALEGRNGPAVIRYMGYSIPAPHKSQSRAFSLTQSGESQTVTALISKVGLRSKTMGMVSFVVPSGAILVGAIEDVQDYSLADNGKTIFSGQWHDGLKARDALAQCLAQKK